MSDELLHSPHHTVVLTISAPGLNPGEFEVVGKFMPEGFLGRGEPRYSYITRSRAQHDRFARNCRIRFGATVKAADTFFELMKPAELKNLSTGSKPLETYLVFSARYWKVNRETMEHPFTDAQIDAADAGDGTLGKWAGAICLTSKKL